MGFEETAGCSYRVQTGYDMIECGGRVNKTRFVSSKEYTDILRYLIQSNDLISWFITPNWPVSIVWKWILFWPKQLNIF